MTLIKVVHLVNLYNLNQNGQWLLVITPPPIHLPTTDLPI
jgi:hypothetical protein